MRIAEWLIHSKSRLEAEGVSTARLDSLVLLEDCLGTNRAQLLARPETVLSDEQINELGAQIERRAAHEPLAYIRGKSEFYGREFSVKNTVLVPRPESETMIDQLKDLLRTNKLPAGQAWTIVDVGTGSGALAITAKLEHPSANVIATDIDPACLEVARDNASRSKADITLLQGDLLHALPPSRDKNVGDTAVLLCNLPYVPEEFHINTAAGREPRLAIFGGPDGLDLYRRLFEQITAMTASLQPRYILTESLPPQHAELKTIAAKHGYQQTTEDDFIQVFAR